MRKITKKTIKRIKAGYHDDLMDAIDFLVDSYNEDQFDNGYKSRIADEAVFAYRLADHIAQRISKPYKPGDVIVGELAKVIEDYFKKALK